MDVFGYRADKGCTFLYPNKNGVFLGAGNRKSQAVRCFLGGGLQSESRFLDALRMFLGIQTALSDNLTKWR